jgi:hypothetical protein
LRRRPASPLASRLWSSPIQSAAAGCEQQHRDRRVMPGTRFRQHQGHDDGTRFSIVMQTDGRPLRSPDAVLTALRQGEQQRGPTNEPRFVSWKPRPRAQSADKSTKLRKSAICGAVTIGCHGAFSFLLVSQRRRQNNRRQRPDLG